MRKIAGFFIISLLLSTNAIATESVKIPTDVQSFLNNADTCEHFAGEWDNSLPKSRQKEIELSVNKYCSLAKKQQRILKEKYRNNTDILNSINNHDF